MLTSRLRSCLDIDIFGNCLRPCISWGVIALGLTISVTQARAEYRVNVGDVLEVAVAGVPELRQRAPVQMDGNISLPLIGMLPVAGLPLPEIRARIGAALASKVFRQRTDGHEIAIVIDADEVTTTVAEYRPVYVNGDVSKPGEYPYRASIDRTPTHRRRGRLRHHAYENEQPVPRVSGLQGRVCIALDTVRQGTGAHVAHQE